ncbi:MAG: amidohydrolase family protein [Syntrophorhabdaceae bacterium]|nr:amidohydrolase family protein [Syntrophorhabdaceae bacterium]MDD4196601.1 amidohydrolase family protein [Syntrophorhabdaceae bacterium]HOC45845.1 amidohydrolase family protein [Syntrophorhabdaceae bacterium]
MGFDLVIDSHSHWGPSLSMGITVSTSELLKQQEDAGIDYVIIIPFPSTAIENNSINVRLLDESNRIESFFPYHYIRENYGTDGFDPLPGSYFGGKWHWMRGIQDSSSNYRVLHDPALPGLVEKIVRTGKPVIFEEDLEFTKIFVEMFPDMTIIIPHLGLLGGYPLDFLNTFKNNENVYFDTALGSRDMILEFVRTIGPERILFGSDVPFGTMKSELTKIAGLSLSDKEKNLIVSGNVIRLARLPL